MSVHTKFPLRSAEEAAALIPHGATLGIGGFTPPGTPIAVPRALADRASRLHAQGVPFQVRIISGAEAGPGVDNDLPAADAVSFRTPFQVEKMLRNSINAGKVEFADIHLSHVAQQILDGIFGPIHFAIIEASDITDDGRVSFTSAIGNGPTLLQQAEKVILELNRHHPRRVGEFSDILMIPLPPHRDPIPIHHALDRIGRPYVTVDPGKIVAVVETDEASPRPQPRPPDATSRKIAEHLVRFLLDERAAGRLPQELPPLQSGVGNVGNGVMAGLGEHTDFPPFTMYTEVFQDSCVELMHTGRLTGASSTALTLSEAKLREVYDDLDYFLQRIVLRPQELSNNPAVIRQLGVIAINTPIEVDIYGHVNSTHLCGTQMMNGIGGSGDFERNAFYSLFVCPSIGKGGKISTIVPFCSHIDHSEHATQVVVTEQGVADLRGVGPMERARRLIDHCAHPAYRDYLHHYVESSPPGHLRHDLARCFELHRNLLEHGAMLPDLDFKSFT